jgi:3-hydroxybutyrate dehydrogenase
MEMTLKGKVAIVTGSTSGIGLGIARQFAGAGADVLLNGFGDAGEIERLQRDIADEYGVRTAYSGADMTKPDQIAGMVQQATRDLGRVDILVNNAGIQHTAPVHEFPADRWDAVIAINLSAAFHASKAALPQMLERNWGRIINIASAHGLVASAQKSAYVASKHGIVGLTKVTALETATTGVTCNAICPGWVLTPLVQKQIDDRAAREEISVAQAKHDLLAEKQPSLEFVTPEQLGGFAVFLCSEAASQIRGQSRARAPCTRVRCSCRARWSTASSCRTRSITGRPTRPSITRPTAPKSACRWRASSPCCSTSARLSLGAARWSCGPARS